MGKFKFLTMRWESYAEMNEVFKDKNSRADLRGMKMSPAKKWIAASLAGVLWIMPVIGSEGLPHFGPGTASVAQAAASFKVTKLGEEVITSGAVMMKYKFVTTRSGKNATGLADVVRVDLTNPYVSLDVMTGKGGNLTTRQSTGGWLQKPAQWLQLMETISIQVVKALLLVDR